MKKIFILTLIGLLSINSYSQNKFGYIDSQELLLLMPERKTAEEEVQTFAKSLESQLDDKFDIVPKEVFEEAQEKAFEELDYEECTEEKCISKVYRTIKQMKLHILIL